MVMRLGLRLDCLRKPSSSSLGPHLARFAGSAPRTLFVSTSGLKKEFKAKREIDVRVSQLVFDCARGGEASQRLLPKGEKPPDSE